MANYNSTGELLSAVADPICASSASVVAALDLLVALSAGCVANMKLLTTMLSDMFFSGNTIFHHYLQYLVKFMNNLLLPTDLLLKNGKFKSVYLLKG